jgi:shikimate dehydrogenase
MTRLVGLIGDKLGHSISPQFQQAAFDRRGLDVRYELWETEADKLPSLVEGLRQPARLGANVTIPYKETVMPLLDEIEPVTGRIGAVNTIVNRDGRLVGYNTDSIGFMRALRRDGGFNSENKHVVILGAGGVARAAGFALIGASVKSLVITDIIESKAHELVAALTRDTDRIRGAAPDVRSLSVDGSQFEQAVSGSDLIVNCTPIGMRHSPAEWQAPLKAGLISGRALVYDLVYNPIETQLLKEARKAGADTLGGLAMLVYQGAAAFELWTGEAAPVDIMMQAAKKAMEDGG